MNRFAKILTGFSLTVLLFGASAHAQASGPRMTANIPFDFNIGQVSFPPGQYEFVRTATFLFQVRDAAGRTRLTAGSAPIQESESPEKSTLKFAIVNGRHVLIQIWSGRTATGNEFRYGHNSVELAKSVTDDRTVIGGR
jgi:hypothetical protein